MGQKKKRRFVPCYTRLKTGEVWYLWRTELDNGQEVFYRMRGGEEAMARYGEWLGVLSCEGIVISRFLQGAQIVGQKHGDDADQGLDNEVDCKMPGVFSSLFVGFLFVEGFLFFFFGLLLRVILR